LIDALDEWAEKNNTSRSEAVRLLISEALEKKPLRKR
jgi:metal-responsive CopG/Arc/MetJ family transcriptional regulator